VARPDDRLLGTPQTAQEGTDEIIRSQQVRDPLLQDLGFLAFTLPGVELLMPTKKPRGEELTLEQQRANQALHQRRLRIEHVNSSVKRCRIVKDRIRLWKEGIRDLVMELCCALHNFRVRLTPWQPMI
jgi:DDE superfamily endonuclease